MLGINCPLIKVYLADFSVLVKVALLIYKRFYKKKDLIIVFGATAATQRNETLD